MRPAQTAGATLLLVVALFRSAGAGADPASLLIGRWAGDIQMAGGTYPRTLVITSVRDASGAPRVDAVFGGTGYDVGGEDPRPAPVAASIETFGDDAILRFRSPEGWPIQLALSHDRRYLYGDLRISATLGAMRAINPLRLDRVD